MVRINLLPIREILRKREFKQFGFTALAIVFAAVALGAIMYFYFEMQRSRLESDTAMYTRKLAELKKKNKEIADLKNEITRLQKQVDTIQKLTKVRDTPAPFMAALSFAMPDEVWLKTIVKSGKSFSLDGTGVDNTVVVSFVERLQKVRKKFTDQRPWLDPRNPKEDSFFSNVKLVSIMAGRSKSGLGTVNFKVVGHVR